MAASYRRPRPDGHAGGPAPPADRDASPATNYCGGMGEGADGRASTSWVMNRRQLLGGGLLGAAGMAVAPLATGSVTGGPTGAGAADAGASPDRPGPPASLRVDGLVAPLGRAADDVYFSWQLRDPRRGARQSAYRIVLSGPVVGPRVGATVWDSGRVSSAAQAFVPYAGPALAPDAAYRWTVQTW